MWQQEIGEYAVRFEDQADEFTHHISVELGDRGYTSARGSDGTTPIELGPPGSAVVDSKLLIHPLDGGDHVRCVVHGEGDAVREDQVEPWRRAATEAAAALGNRDRRYLFDAIIGPMGYGFDQTAQFAGPHRLGPLELTSSGVHMREFLTEPEHITSGCVLRYSIPVVVSGSATTYTWRAAAPIAEWAVRRACALMTLATGSLWSPRTRPQERTEHTRLPEVPATVGAPPIPDPHDHWTGEIPQDTPLLELGSWTEEAWQILRGDQQLDRAVEAHYQAVRLEDDRHTSAAYLMFVAAIEGFGTRLVDDADCTCHPECRHDKPVAQKRFRKALKTVLTNSQVERLAANAYNLRSRTGHTGALFGAERTFGNPGFQLSGVPVTYIFEGPILSEIRWASRRVLLKALGAPDPARLAHLAQP